MTLHPDHLEDLRRSGLSDETIERYRIESVPTEDLGRELGGIASHIKSSYRIPYEGHNGFCRFKLFPPVGSQKYHQPKDTTPHLFLTTKGEAARTDPRIELALTEGEKKALRLEQEGLAALGLGGLWSWMSNGKPLSDLDCFDWCDRAVLLLPDSDVWTRPDLLQAVFALGKELEARGAKVKTLKLPAAEGKGVDDYLANHTKTELLKLPTLELKHPVFTKTREWWKAWKQDKGEKGKSAGSAFDDVAPAEQSVNGAELVEDLRRFISSYIVASKEAVLAATLWVITTWTLDAFSTAPILNITSPAKRCGKTRLLEILSMVVKKPLAASNISAAAVFRAIDKWSPTLLVDEADTFLATNEELRGVLNSSHYRSGAFVVRVVGEQLEPKQFSTWCAKAISGIGKLKADTLEDRSIRIPLKRKARGDSVDRLVHSEAEARTRNIRARLSRWSKDNLRELTRQVDGTDLPHELDDRSQDNWRPLLTIADMTGLGAEARKVAVHFGANQEDDSGSVLLLQVIRDLLDGREAIESERILEHVLEREDLPFQEWRKGKAISKNGIARLLKPYGIRPKQIWFAGGKTRGYRLEDCIEAFGRYLPVQTGRTGRSQQNQQDTAGTKPVEGEGSTGLKTPVSDSKQSVLPLLPDETPVEGTEEALTDEDAHRKEEAPWPTRRY